MGYRPDRKTIAIDEARAILAAHGEPVTRTERVAVADASGRVLARALVADRDVPPFARAAMDGYAVRATDTSGATRDHGIELRIVETVYSGMTPSRPIEAGTCAAIATGAPMPDGADAVVMVEHTRRDGDRVRIFEAVQPRQHVGRAGSDLVAGEIALAEEHGALPGAARRCIRARRRPESMFTASHASRFFRRATRSSHLAAACEAGRSSTRTQRRWRPRSPPTAASQWWRRAPATIARR